MSYFVGEAVTLSNWAGPLATPTGGYLNASGVLYDPATPTLRYRFPGQSIVTVTNATNPALTKDAVGLYHYVITPSADGVIVGSWSSNDGAYYPFTIEVQPAPI